MRRVPSPEHEALDPTPTHKRSAYGVMLMLTAGEVTVVPFVPGADAVALTVTGGPGTSVLMAKA